MSSDKEKHRKKLRERIPVAKLLRDVEEIADVLYGKQGPYDATSDKAKVEKLHAVRVGALKASADLKLKLIAKVLPDLKAVEHELGDSFDNVTEQELDERIERVKRQLETGTTAPPRGEGETLQ